MDYFPNDVVFETIERFLNHLLHIITLNDSLDRAWRRTGVALDRSGFTVEDRDRSSGVYFVRYVAAGKSMEEPGFFSRLFSSKKELSTLARYRISVSAVSPEQSLIRILNAEGQAATAEEAERILKLIGAQLR